MDRRASIGQSGLRRGRAYGAALVCAAAMSACTAPQGPPPAASPLTPTIVSPAAATASPSRSPTASAGAAETPAALPVTPTQPVASPPAASTSACRDRAGFVSDVTVRDNAELAPGQPFVKIWRLANTGTCTWTPDYALVFFGGDRMAAAATVPLSATIGPGLEVDLPVDLTAPEHPGTYQGFWRLRNPAGALFGIGPAGDQSFWVKIIVVALPTPSVTPSATMTATPDIVATGTLEYPPASSFDLDSGQPDSSDRADVTLSGISLEDGALSPSSGARIAPYAPPPAVPGPVDCWSATLGDQALPAAGLSAGSLICYVTGLGRPGYFEVLQVDDALTLRFTTWNP